MTDLLQTVALTVEGRALSLQECLTRLKVANRLIDAFRPVIEELIVEKAINEHGIAVDQEDLQMLADEWRAENGLYKAEDTHEWLQDENLTLEQFEQRLRDQYRRELVKEAVTRDKIENYFAEHRSEFDSAELSQILVADEGVAQELRTQICEEGADFAAMARKHSADMDTRELGGRIGRVGREELNPAMQTAVFTAQTGQVLGPIKLEEGYCLVRVDQLQFAELTDEIRDTIENRLFDEWLAQQYEQAEVSLPLLATV